MLIRFAGGVRRIGFLPKPQALLGIGAGVLAAGLALNCRPYSVPGYLRIIPRRNNAYSLVSRSISLFSLDNSKMVSLTPPQSPISWSHSPSDVVATTKELIAKNRELLDRIAAVPHKDCTFESVSSALDISPCLQY